MHPSKTKSKYSKREKDRNKVTFLIKLTFKYTLKKHTFKLIHTMLDIKIGWKDCVCVEALSERMIFRWIYECEYCFCQEKI